MYLNRIIGELFLLPPSCFSTTLFQCVLYRICMNGIILASTLLAVFEKPVLSYTALI